MNKLELTYAYQTSFRKTVGQSHQHILDLYLIEGKSKKDIAALLNKSFLATNQEITRAILELRKVCKDPEYLKARKILYGSQDVMGQ